MAPSYCLPFQASLIKREIPGGRGFFLNRKLWQQGVLVDKAHDLTPLSPLPPCTQTLRDLPVCYRLPLVPRATSLLTPWLLTRTQLPAIGHLSPHPLVPRLCPPSATFPFLPPSTFPDDQGYQHRSSPVALAIEAQGTGEVLGEWLLPPLGRGVERWCPLFRDDLEPEVGTKTTQPYPRESRWG